MAKKFNHEGAFGEIRRYLQSLPAFGPTLREPPEREVPQPIDYLFVVVVEFVEAAGGVVVSLFGPQAAKSPTTAANIKTFFIYP